MMLASVRTCSTLTMSLNTSQSSSPQKRPRLSLQIKTPATAQTLGKSATALKSDIDPSSPTAFNTLSNAYAVAIENASPRTARPLSTSLDTKFTRRTSLRLETGNFSGDNDYVHPSQRTQTPGPFSITYPDTPSSAYPSLTPTTTAQPQPLSEPKPTATSFTFTPPQSAGSDHSLPRIFTFAANNPSTSSPSTPRTPRRRMTIGSQIAPYTHPRSLHSILRNSPLPPGSTITPATPTRVSMRLANRASKKVGYNDPLTQTITTNKYVKSHIDLLSEDSPYSATDPEAAEKPEALDLTMAYTGDETRDGGQTPGPFEEMRRRMAESDLETPGTRKRKRREKKRKWEWTITTTEKEDGDGNDTPVGRTPLTAVMLARTPITAIRRGASVSEDSASEVSEAEERYVPPSMSVSEDSEMSESGDWNGSMTREGIALGN
ncbi:hypothetical protein BKA65DRAFT_526465 [Rhexocercosporidium sp. MPI-PUGE-AT-0058]|nr:hypothetical protein BKA65DRAFT_526465 [Rhexocercosporidium sp. MPI-PUGE-AT-0058]